jgi:nucleoside-diphosphate-sugar epimerase
VDGTRHVVQACRAQRAPRLVFTSTPSVVHGEFGIEGGDESLPYPPRYLAAYPATKAEAECQVLSANGPALATVALRPHLLLGPGDPHLVPRLVARRRAGRLRRIGDAPCRVDWTDVDDAATAHLAACDRLTSHEATVAGRAYFLSQGAPEPLWELIDRILVACGEPPVDRTISAEWAYIAGAVCEWTYAAIDARKEPPMTRFVAHQLSSAHWFDIGAARRDLGYDPRVTLSQELERIGAWFRNTGI